MVMVCCMSRFFCLFVRFAFVSAAGARESGGNGWQNVQAIFCC